MVHRVAILMVFCLAGAAVCAAQYTSTTSVTASANGSDIFGSVFAGWTGNCIEDTEEPPSYSVTIGGLYYLTEYGGESGQFDSANDDDANFGPGTYDVEGSFSGFDSLSDNCSVGGSSGGTTVTVVGPFPSTTTLKSSPNKPLREGQTVTITVAVTEDFVMGPVPSGDVVLFNGSEVVASQALTSDGGAEYITGVAVFNLSTAGITPGKYHITAAYGGDTNYNSSSSSADNITITAPQVATTTALSSSAPSVQEGDALTLTATVAPTVSGITPTGTVTFLLGSTPIGTAALDKTGVATLRESSAGVPPGVYAIHASYGGDTYDFASVSSTVDVTVKSVTATTLSANPTKVTEGQAVNFTAKVVRSVNSGIPTGTVSFEYAGTALATATLSSGSATASFLTTNLTSGTYPITAKYGGDTLDAKSTSSVVTITVQ